jgi:hypothetical protein
MTSPVACARSALECTARGTPWRRRLGVSLNGIEAAVVLALGEICRTGARGSKHAPPRPPGAAAAPSLWLREILDDQLERPDSGMRRSTIAPLLEALRATRVDQIAEVSGDLDHIQRLLLDPR